MLPNAVLTIEFPNNTYTYPVEWTGRYFINGSEVAEDIFFNSNPKIQNDFSEGYPEMNVVFAQNPNIKCQVYFESETGEVYPARDLAKLQMKNP